MNRRSFLSRCIAGALAASVRWLPVPEAPRVDEFAGHRLLGRDNLGADGAGSLPPWARNQADLDRMRASPFWNEEAQALDFGKSQSDDRYDVADWIAWTAPLPPHPLKRLR